MSNIEVPQGDNISWEILVMDQDDSIVDLSSAEIYFYAKESLDALDSSAIITKKNTAGSGGDDEISFTTDGTDGKAKIHLVPADTSSYDNTYTWKVKVVKDSKTYTPTGLTGFIEIIGVI